VLNPGYAHIMFAPHQSRAGDANGHSYSNSCGYSDTDVFANSDANFNTYS
jgi:hypothetical protein